MALALLSSGAMRSVVVIALIGLASAAWGGVLDDQRAAARVAEDRVTQLRATQRTTRGELATVSARIEALKAEKRSALSSGAELDAALKTSQELSTTLSTLAQQLASLEAERDAAHSALERGLSDELKRTRSAFDASTDRERRLSLITSMRQLRAERAAIRARLPVARVPGDEALKAVELEASDPEALLEQAELLRDTEAKVAKELSAVETRLAERRDELALDRRVQRFLGEESMFDDQDRRLRVQRTTTTTAVPSARTEGQTASGPVGGVPAPAASVDITAGSTSLGAGGAPGYANQAFENKRESDANQAPTPSGDLAPSSIRITNGSDARPQLGSPPAPLAVDDDMAGLDAERSRLQQLGAQLRTKATELERRAATLKE